MASAKKKSDRSASAAYRTRLLRAVPPVDECLKAALNDPVLGNFSRNYLKVVIRRSQSFLRDTILADPDPGAQDVDASTSREMMLARVLDTARAAATADEPALKSVVNATGVVLHTNLGRALLAEAAIKAVERAARTSVNLEYDLESGTRGERDELVEEELCALTGAEAATVVNNNAAAVLLALNSLADGRDVVVSRGELVEIGGSFRIPEVMARSGARLREVGTTNRTHPRDYATAIGPETALLLKVHPSNYRVVGFTAEVGLAELVEIGRAHDLEVMEDLGSGALVDMSAWGLPREPIVAERIAAGAGVVTFSGDKLLGGPQCGIIVGRHELIEQLRANPLKRALRCDKLTLAALGATLRLYLSSPNLPEELPTLRMLRRTPEELEVVAARACDILAERLGTEFQLVVVETTSAIGSGALPIEQLPSRAIRITHPRLKPEEVATMFRRSRPPVIGRIRDGAFQLDLRTVEDAAVLAIELPHDRA